MIDSLYIGASGLVSHQNGVDTVANNLVNMNTTAFKKARTSFKDVYANELNKMSESGGSLTGNVLPSGVAVTGTERVFSEGEYKNTGNALDWAIRGSGFFEVLLPDGSSAFTRAGQFRINDEGVVTTVEGYPLSQNIEIPDGATQLSVDASGVVRAVLPGDTAQQEIAQLELARFTNPGALKPLGNALFVVSENSGEARMSKPGEDGSGAVAQGFVETSNVQLNEELLSLMVAQRGYEASSKVVQASDEILGIVNNLRR